MGKIPHHRAKGLESHFWFQNHRYVNHATVLACIASYWATWVVTGSDWNWFVWETRMNQAGWSWGLVHRFTLRKLPHGFQHHSKIRRMISLDAVFWIIYVTTVKLPICLCMKSLCSLLADLASVGPFSYSFSKCVGMCFYCHVVLLDGFEARKCYICASEFGNWRVATPWIHSATGLCDILSHSNLRSISVKLYEERFQRSCSPRTHWEGVRLAWRRCLEDGFGEIDPVHH